MPAGNVAERSGGLGPGALFLARGRSLLFMPLAPFFLPASPPVPFAAHSDSPVGAETASACPLLPALKIPSRHRHPCPRTSWSGGRSLRARKLEDTERSSSLASRRDRGPREGTCPSSSRLGPNQDCSPVLSTPHCLSQGQARVCRVRAAPQPAITPGGRQAGGAVLPQSMP